MRGVVCALLVVLGACTQEHRFPASITPPSSSVQYLLDLQSGSNAKALEKTTTHLVVFNPSTSTQPLAITAYFTDRPPIRFHWTVPPQSSAETNTEGNLLPKASRMALKIESGSAVVAQTTVGWTNTGGDYRPRATTLNGATQQEAARATAGVRSLSTRLAHADGILLDHPESLWIREEEQLVVLNPSNVTADLELRLLSGGRNVRVALQVPPERMARWDLAPFVSRKNRLYGATLQASVPVAAQWVRTVYHFRRPQPMAFWSLPLTPIP